MPGGQGGAQLPGARGGRGRHQPGPQRARRPRRSRHRTEFSAGPTAAPTPRCPAWAGRRRLRRRTAERLAVTFNWTKRLSVRPQSTRCPHSSIESFCRRLRPPRREPAAARVASLVLARRVHAVGQQDNIEVALPVDPQRRAGESGVADRGRRQARAARRCRQHGVPSERTRAAWHS